MPARCAARCTASRSGVKDIFDTADLPTGYGSPIYKRHRPKADAACVAAARAAGAVIIGKTVTTEFATMVPPRRCIRVIRAARPGGSSSGSAAAVAAGMVRFAYGTQTVGSIIRPAAYCGVVGYKPSYGMLSRSGMKMGAESLDTAGVIARNVADAALLAGASAMRTDLIEGRLSKTPLSACAARRTGSTCRAKAPMPSPTAAERLAGKGARLAEFVLPFEELDAAASTILVYEMARGLAHEVAHHRARIAPMLLERIDAGACDALFKKYQQAMAVRERLQAQARGPLRRLDAILTPSATGEAPLGLEQHRQHRDESPVDAAARALRHGSGRRWPRRTAGRCPARRPARRRCAHAGGGEMGRGESLKAPRAASVAARAIRVTPTNVIQKAG